MRRILIAAGLLALLLLLAWHLLGGDLVRTWLFFQKNANGYVAQQMRALKEGQSLAPLLGGLCLAFGYGVLHAIGPGHGKLVIASYLATRDAKPWYGFLMAARIGVMHVLSAVLVVAFADFLLRRTFGGIPTEIPAIRIAAYGILSATGAWMMLHAVRRLRSRPAVPPANPGTSLVQAHLHRPPPAAPVLAKRRETGLLAVAVGLVPCTGSILILSFAIANGVLWAGYLLVAAIAFGMTLTMALLAQGAIHLNRLVVRRTRPGSLAPRILDLAGAAVVTGFGLLLLTGSLLS